MRDHGRAHPAARMYLRMAAGPEDLLVDGRCSARRRVATIAALVLLLAAAFAMAGSLPGVGPLGDDLAVASGNGKEGGGTLGGEGDDDLEGDDFESDWPEVDDEAWDGEEDFEGEDAEGYVDNVLDDPDATDLADETEANTGAETAGNTDAGGQDTGRSTAGETDTGDATGKSEVTEGTGRETRGKTDPGGKDTGVSTRGETDPGDKTGKTERR